MHTARRPLSVLLVTALLTAGWTRVSSAAEVKEELDVVYATANGEDLKLDLYTPADLKSPAPLVLYIHGGGWAGGNKVGGRGMARALATQGYVSATVGYRLVPKATFPAQVQDVRNAVRFFRANATKYGIDSQKVGAFGHSAGGHLSLMLGLMDPGDKLAGEEPLNAESSQVQAVVNFFGPSDLTRTNWPPRIEAILVNFMGGSRETVGDRFKAASPVTYIDKDDPPILTFHGTTDDIVPFDQAEVLHAALEKAGTPNQLVTLKGEGHGFRAPEALTDTLKQTQDFFAKHLKPAK